MQTAAFRALSAFAASLLAVFSAGCSADSVTPPEPGVETPGAFVAVQTASAGIQLFRTVGRGALDDGDFLMVMILYAPRPASFAEARELARQPALPEEVHQFFVEQSRLASRPHEVVWFRTLTPEETAPSPR
jgi:hypothetical protein